MRFSKTDIFLSEGVQWAFVEGKNLGEITSANASWSNDTDDSLDWYTYDMAVHRVNPNEGTYLLLEDGIIYKLEILSYYNEDDESRFPTMLVSALNKTEYPALSDPNLIIPSPCLIEPNDDTFSHWNSTETVTLLENGIDICSGECTFEVNILFETAKVKITNIEIIT